MAEINNVVTNEEAADIVTEMNSMPVTKPHFGRNIVTGIGIGVTGALAIYGLVELGKKGVKLIKKQIEKNKAEHPVYEYEKVEIENEIDKATDEIKAMKKHKKEKHPMGFQYKA